MNSFEYSDNFSCANHTKQNIRERLLLSQFRTRLFAAAGFGIVAVNEAYTDNERLALLAVTGCTIAAVTERHFAHRKADRILSTFILSTAKSNDANGTDPNQNDSLDVSPRPIAENLVPLSGASTMLFSLYPSAMISSIENGNAASLGIAITAITAAALIIDGRNTAAMIASYNQTINNAVSDSSPE